MTEDLLTATEHDKFIADKYMVPLPEGKYYLRKDGRWKRERWWHKIRPPRNMYVGTSTEIGKPIHYYRLISNRAWLHVRF